MHHSLVVVGGACLALFAVAAPAYAEPTDPPDDTRPTTKAPGSSDQPAPPATRVPDPRPTSITRGPAPARPPTRKAPAPTRPAADPTRSRRTPAPTRAIPRETTATVGTTPPASLSSPETAASPQPVPEPELDAKALIGPAQCEEGRRIVPVWAANGTATDLAVRLRIDQTITDLALVPAGGRTAAVPPLGAGSHRVAVLAGERVLAEVTTQAECGDGRTDTVTASTACAGITFTNRFPMSVTIRWGHPRSLSDVVEVAAGGVVTVPGVRPESLWVAQSPEFLRAGVERFPAACPAAGSTPTPRAQPSPTSPSGPGPVAWTALAGAGLTLAGLGGWAFRSRLRD